MDWFIVFLFKPIVKRTLDQDFPLYLVNGLPHRLGICLGYEISPDARLHILRYALGCQILCYLHLFTPSFLYAYQRVRYVGVQRTFGERRHLRSGRQFSWWVLHET